MHWCTAINIILYTQFNKIGKSAISWLNRLGNLTSKENWYWNFEISFLICFKLPINPDFDTFRYYHSLRKLLSSSKFYISENYILFNLNSRRPIVVWCSAKSFITAFLPHHGPRQRKNVSRNRKKQTFLCLNESTQWLKDLFFLNYNHLLLLIIWTLEWYEVLYKSNFFYFY